LILARQGFHFSILILILATFTPVSLITPGARAATAESKMMTGSNDPTAREINELKVKRALENKIVADKLMGHGLTPDEVSQKLGSMTDEQVHQMAALADKVPAGGDAGLGIVIAILVIAALVLLIVYLFKRV